MTGHRALIWNSGQIWSSIFLSFHACCLNYLSSSEHHIYTVTVYHQSWLKTPPRHSRLPSWRRQRGRVDLSPRSLPWTVRHCPPDIYSFMHMYLVTQVNLVPGRRPFQELQRRACPPRCAPRSWTGWWCTPIPRPPSSQLWQSRSFARHTPRLRWCSPYYLHGIIICTVFVGYLIWSSKVTLTSTSCRIVGNSEGHEAREPQPGNKIILLDRPHKRKLMRFEIYWMILKQERMVQLP